MALVIPGSLGGGAFIVVGLSSWLGKVWANRILEADRRRYNEQLERIRGDLEKTTHVYRVQFETEFKTLSEIWKTVAAVRSTMGRVRPIARIANPGEDEASRLREDFKDFSAAFNELVKAVDYSSPFYPETILDELHNAIQIARREKMDVQLTGPKDTGWYEAGERNYRDIVASAECVSKLIRARLESLRVS